MLCCLCAQRCSCRFRFEPRKRNGERSTRRSTSVRDRGRNTPRSSSWRQATASIFWRKRRPPTESSGIRWNAPRTASSFLAMYLPNMSRSAARISPPICGRRASRRPTMQGSLRCIRNILLGNSGRCRRGLPGQRSLQAKRWSAETWSITRAILPISTLQMSTKTANRSAVTGILGSRHPGRRSNTIWTRATS